jgi:acylphosphatase
VKLAAATFIVEGKVQGVGYRNFARRRARELGLTGYAVNLTGGRVKVRAEGPAPSLDRYARDLEAGPPLAAVRSVSRTDVPFSGEFREFLIRFSEGAWGSWWRRVS